MIVPEPEQYLNADGSTNYTPDGRPPGPDLKPRCDDERGHDWQRLTYRDGRPYATPAGTAVYECTRCKDQCP